MAKGLFESSGEPNVYTMPAGAPFLKLLAQGLREALGDRLSDALILLPTRRAVRELGEAFVETAGGTKRAALLPMMRPLADVDPDEPPFEPGDLAHTITPAINSVKRKFELSKLVLAKERNLRGLAPDPAAALALTEPVLRLLDDAAMEELSGANLAELDAIIELSAKHYEHAAIFYKIVQEYWPQYLEQNGVMDPMQRRVALLRALANLWEETPPNHPVIIAGSTGTLAATANLIRVVAKQKDGLIVLPGLDQNIDDEGVWDKINDEHPQASLKRLIQTIGIERGDVNYWPNRRDSQGAAARRRLISEALIPADATADWLARIAAIRAGVKDSDPVLDALEGLSLIEARHQDEEAAVIALAMRATLSEAGKAAALVTPDPALGRRVRAKLSRWNVEVDVSAGEPLEETSVGAFISVMLTLANDPWDPVALASIFKHPLTGLGRKPREVQSLWNALEIAGFRGMRPRNEAELRERYGIRRADFEPHIAMLADLHAALKPLGEAMELVSGARDFARMHCQLAESLATTDTTHGADRLWTGEAGEAAAGLMSDMLQHGDILDDVDGGGYARLLAAMMRGRVVRPRYGMHPRLQILGPLEARMLRADLIILGGLNEGVWPAALSVDPLLSYAMRKELSLSSPERRFGLSAHDFAQLAAHENVLLTRASKSDDGPAVASRWIWRLKTLVRGALGDEAAMEAALSPAQPYLEWAQSLDHVEAQDVTPAPAPKPKPPVDKRWPLGRRLNVSRIETWVRDPYAIYADRILRLSPLDPLDKDIDAREYGSAIHDALEAFAKQFTKTVPAKAADWLTVEFESALLSKGYAPEAMASERVRLRRIADWFTHWDRERRKGGVYPVGIEVSGEVNLSPPSGESFTLTARADRIDKSVSGYSIIDYKTGNPPTAPQVKSGFRSQLPLEAMILEITGYETKGSGLLTGEPEDLVYLHLQGRKAPSYAKSLKDKDWDARRYTAEAFEGLLELIAHFDDPDTVYESQPRALNVNPYGDYDHLARRAEWASAGEDGSGGEGGS